MLSKAGPIWVTPSWHWSLGRTPQYDTAWVEKYAASGILTKAKGQQRNRGRDSPILLSTLIDA